MSGGARFGLALLGAVLLLPGACSLYFTPLAAPVILAIPGLLRGDAGGLVYLTYWLLWPAGLALGATGVWLLWGARKE